MTIRVLPVLALSLGFALACGGGSAPTATTTAPPPPPAPVAAAGTIGVPECDEYIKKMDDCVAKADPAAKPALETSFKTTKDAWAQAAANPATKAALGPSCAAMLSSVDATCAAAAGTGAMATPGAAGGTPAAVGSAAGTPAPGTTTTTSTTVTTTSSTTPATTTTVTKASDEGRKANLPARDTRPPADMSRTRPGSTSTTTTTTNKTGGTATGTHSRPK